MMTITTGRFHLDAVPMLQKILILLFISTHSFAYIDAAIEMSLVGGREIMLVFDAYKGYPLSFNKAHAVALSWAAKNIAASVPDKKIDFSYEDPAVYDAGKLLG